jgi:hypothetical protein
MTITQVEVRSELKDYLLEHGKGLPYWLKEAVEAWVLAVDLGQNLVVYFDEQQNRQERETNIMTLLELTEFSPVFNKYRDWLMDQKVKWKKS